MTSRSRPPAPRAPARPLPGLAALLGAAFTLGFTLAAPAAAQDPAAAGAAAESRRSFSIAGGPLDAVLTRFGEAAGVEISADARLLTGLASEGVSGDLRIGEGLDALLRPHGLEARRQPDGSYSVRRRVAPAAAAGEPGSLAPVVIRSSPVPASAADPVPGYVATRTVSGTKTDTPLIEVPQVINVITRAQMDDQGAQSVAEALRYTAGVMPEPNGFDVRYEWNYIRGYDTFGVQWLDGLAIPGDPSNYAVPRIPAYALERVEVIKGPASVLYGKSPPGGMLNQVSKLPQAQARREVQLSATQFGGAQAAADLTGPLDEAGAWRYRLVALRRDAGTQIDRERDRQLMLAPSLTWQPSARTSLTLQGYYHRDDSRISARFYPAMGTLLRSPEFGYIPRNLYLGEPGVDRFRREVRMLGYTVEHRFTDAISVRQQLRYGRSAQDMFLVRVHPGAAFDDDGHTLNRVSAVSDDDIRSLAVDTRLEARVQTGPVRHTILGGVDYVDTRLSTNFANTGVGVPGLDLLNPVYGVEVPRPQRLGRSTYQRARQVGYYLQDQVRFDRFIGTVGLRHDRSSIRSTDRLDEEVPVEVTHDSNTSGRFGLTYLSASGFAPYVGLSTSYLPTTGVDREGGTFKPQIGRQAEIGVKFEPADGRSQITVSLFRNDVRNALTVDPVDTDYSVQAGRLRVQGIEIEGKADLGRQVRLLAAYAYNDATIVRSSDAATAGRPMLMTPRHQASAWVDYRFASLAGLRVGVGARYLGSYASADDYDPTLKIPSLLLWDLGASWQLGQLAPQLKGVLLRLAVSNLTDKRYVSHCLSVEGSGCNYGARRTITGTVSYTW